MRNEAMPITKEPVTPAVEIKNVIKRFGTITAVDNMNLAIKQGEIFSLLGPSGCGKTTMLRMVAGFENADHGEIRIQGKVVNDIPPYKRECNLVFQQMALFPHLTVAENIAFGLRERRRPQSEIKKKVMEMLDVVNLPGMENRFPHQLSGGQKQRVALARAIVLNPKVLLLDEPLAALDRRLRKEMQGELRRVQQEVGITFLYVTHDQKVALSLSDRIGIMYEGRINQIGTPAEIYETPRTSFVAKFMGGCNIFSGKATSINNNHLEVRDEHGLSIRAQKCKDVKLEEVSGISIHPEMIEIIPEGHELPSSDSITNTITSKITDVSYQGDFTELQVLIKSTGQKVTVHLNRRSDNSMSLVKGQEVSIYWDSCHSNLLVG